MDISFKHGIVEHVHLIHKRSTSKSEIYMALFKEFQDVFTWSYEEIPSIDPLIVVHDIKAYPVVKPVRKKFIRSNLEKLQLSKLKLKNF